MIASIWPGSTARAAGAVTCASTLPTATAIPAGRPVQAAASAVRVPAACAELADPVRELALGEVGEVRVERGQELAARVAPVLVDPLVAGRARVADVGPGQLPDDPVGRLDPVVHPPVDLGVLLEQLQPLRELPLGRDQPAVARQPALGPLGRERVDPVRLRLGGVVLPQLHVGVRPVGVLEHLAQRRPVGEDRQDRAGGEVGPDPDHVGRVDARRQDRRRHRLPQHRHVVGRDLQRPVRRELTAAGQRAVHDPVRVLGHGGADLATVTDPHHQSPTGKRSVVHADDVLLAAHALLVPRVM